MLLAALFDVRLFLQDVPDLFQQNDVIRLGRGAAGVSSLLRLSEPMSLMATKMEKAMMMKSMVA